MPSYKNAYTNNHVDFEITDIVWEDDYIEQISGIEIPEERDETTQENLRALGPRGEALIDERTEAIEEAEALAEELETSILFEYKAPAIAVDTAGRFATHEITGGSTVRQKIGEEPIEVSINGVVKEPTARRLDNLRDAQFGTILSNRLPRGSLQVHFASTSTSPLQDGGAVAMDDDEFLYTFDMSCVEVFV